MRKLILMMVLVAATVPVFAQPTEDHSRSIQELESEVSSLKSKVRSLESEMRSVKTRLDDAAIAAFFFAVFCAWWAQHTGRNPWAWFFLGLIFHIITAFVLLSKNAADERSKRPYLGKRLTP